MILKTNTFAVYCAPSYGPTHGYNCDIYVHADLQGGHSHTLRTTYDISGHNIVDKANNIFGAATP